MSRQSESFSSVGIALHVEGLHRRGVSVDHHGFVEAARDDGLVFGAEVVAPLEVGDRRAVGVRLAFGAARSAVLVDHRHRFVVADAGEGPDDALELAHVALEDRELIAALLEHAGDDEGHEPLGELHVAGEVHEGDLWLDHPELGEVAARLALLGAEGGAEAVRLAEGRGRSLHVELAGLREVSRIAVVVGLEERARALAGVGREDRRIDEREVELVEVVAHGLDDRVTHPHDRVLSFGPEPQVAVVHEKIGSVLLGRDGVLADGLREHREALGADLEHARLLRVGLHLADDLEARLLREVIGGGEGRVVDVPLAHHALDHAEAVAQL
jgi:hypothetical protein